MTASAYTSSSMSLDAINQLVLHPNRLMGAAAFNAPPVQHYQEPDQMKTQRRLVQIFIADPDDNVPLDQCLLYSGEQQLTDLTDQELFFEVDVRTMLETHNVKRIKLVNKAVKERTEHLEPARVRDLKMTVVTVAQF